MDRKWIYATKANNSSWDILHTNYVKDQTSLYLICSSVHNGREMLCNRGLMQERNATGSTASCSRRIRAETVSVENENFCRRQGGEFYQVRYTLPAGTIVTLYEVCYNKLSEQPLYTRHKSYGFVMPASTYNRPTFSRGNVVSRARELSFQAAHVYNTFVHLLGDRQAFVPTNKTLILDRGHLVNSQDFLTYDQMDETFKYINVVPQFRGSNRSNWKRIENWIRNLASSSTYAQVVTGTIGVLSLPHSVTGQDISMYLMADKKNPIPLWLYKVVQYAGICYAFVTLNNDFNANAQINTNACAIVQCPDGLQFSTAAASGISYCCNYRHFVRSIGRHAVLC